MTTKKMQPVYVPAQVKTIEIKAQAIICTSYDGGTKSLGLEDFGDGGFLEQ